MKNYTEVSNKIDRIKKDTDILIYNSDKKRDEIKISDKEFDKEINLFRDVKNNKEFINKYINETKENLNKVKWRIEKTIEPHVKYKYIRRSISSQTKRLAAITALNGLRPGHSKLSMIALSLFTGVSSISDLLGYDLKRIEYNTIIEKEFLEGIDSIDTKKAKYLIENSKDQIDNILYDCQKKYSNYPKFEQLKKDLNKLKMDIESQEKELDIIDNKIYDYKSGPRVKILKYNQE